MTKISEPVLTTIIDPALFVAPGPALATRLYQALMHAIRSGRLADGNVLPSTRTAAAVLGLSRNTVIAAYDLLRAEGLIDTRAGAAPKVQYADTPTRTKPVSNGGAHALSARGAALAEDPRALAGAARDGVMAPGCPDADLFPSDLWARALRQAARQHQGAAFGYGDYHGLTSLRTALSERLRSDRGVAAQPDQILILPGTQAALALLAQTIADPGQSAALEDPGYAGARAAFLGAGLRLWPLPTDAAGADPAALTDAPDLRLIYLTPSNQYPLGGRLSHQRRIEFLARARAQGAVIIEDDYDGEFQWRGQQIAAMHPLSCEGEAVYLGTPAKALMPGLRLGWAVIPDALIDPLRRAQRNLGLGANVHSQAALAQMMRAGQYRAHLRRIARTYAERGDAFVTALQARFGTALSVALPDGGVQLAIRFEGAAREAACHQVLHRHGFSPARLSGFGISHQPTGLVIGFSDATPARITRFVEAMEEGMSGTHS
ncbi:MAG: PLP-dependent aminotransferase family protein [Albidovulum sp.]